MTTCTGVIAHRNQVAFLDDAVRSLAAQCDEVIVVDDGRTPESQVVLNKLLKQLDNVKALSNASSLGVSFALNMAVREASSDVILIQGADDISLPQRRDVQVLALSDPSVVLSYSKPMVMSASGRNLPDEAAPEFQVDLPDGANLMRQLFLRGNFICAPAVAMRRDDFLRLGGFPENNVYLQDLALWLAASLHGEFHRSASPLVKYRKHPNNSSGIRNQSNIDVRSRFLTEYRETLCQFIDQTTVSELRTCFPDMNLPSVLHVSVIEPVLRALILAQAPVQGMAEECVSRLISCSRGQTDGPTVEALARLIEQIGSVSFRYSMG